LLFFKGFFGFALRAVCARGQYYAGEPAAAAAAAQAAQAAAETAELKARTCEVNKTM
jgi:hypothetical protein